MGCIRVLDDLLVNKIAAGEVVERPASVVKELLENAIDAAATQLTLEIEDGGKRLIRLVDDGCGMQADDLRLAVTPHATSKLATEDDLYAIGTLGFRGEALASIGSVSHLRVTSRPVAANEGHTIQVQGGRIDGPTVAGCAAGTAIEVRQLFFNVPARAKFLRAATTEMSHIAEQVTRLALGHRQLGFVVRHNGRETLRLASASDPQQRIAALFSDELAADLIPIQRDERGVRIEGFLAPPARARSSGRWQYVLLNGRYIRDRFVQHAITEAHRGLVDARNQPVVFLLITVAPDSVDVNVHPTKVEVRWRDSGLIHSQVLSVLRDALLSRDLSARLGVRAEEPDVSDSRREAIRREMAEFFKSATPHVPQTPEQARYASKSSHDQERNVASTNDTPFQRVTPLNTKPHMALYAPVEPSTPTPDAGLDAPRPTDADALRAISDMRSQGTRAIQLHNTYLVAETEDGLMIVDQHALHERVLYNEFKERLTRGALESQRLLLPETIEATQGQMARLEHFDDLLRRLGFEVSPFGPTTVAVHAVPSLLPDTTVRDFFVALLDRLSDLPTEPEAEEALHTVLDMMACKAAVKAGDQLSAAEIESLLSKGSTVEKHTNCPHGRPTTLRMTVRELEKQFHRT